MSTKKTVEQRPSFNDTTYAWLMAATEAMPVNPKHIDLNQLVWNACLADLRKKIQILHNGGSL